MPNSIKPEKALGAIQAARHRRLLFFRPLDHQSSFLEATASKGEVGLLAGNQTGKTMCGGALVAITATGLYPSWYSGRRFPGPTSWWVAGKTFEATRDITQAMLLGKDLYEHLGTGLIPKRHIGRWTRRTGVPEAVDRVAIRHVSGGWSRIQFKAYEQGEAKFRGVTLHGVWNDEEPPADVYSEELARLTQRHGSMVLTLTPLEGMTNVVRYFWPSPSSPDRALIRAEIETCGLYPKAFIDRQIAKYRPHEREARRSGIPLQGSGPVFPIAESEITVADFPIPEGWRRIAGIDFGMGEHPTGGTLLVLQPGSGNSQERAYVVRDHRATETNPLLHAAAIKAWGKVPVAWPHDGGKMSDMQSQIPLSSLYRNHGLMMLPSHATFPAGGFGLDASIAEMFEWMQAGRFKVFHSCQTWLEEFRQYHMKAGAVVKERDDVISASRYAFMMRRYARTVDGGVERENLPTVQSGLHADLFQLQEERP